MVRRGCFVLGALLAFAAACAGDEPVTEATGTGTSSGSDTTASASSGALDTTAAESSDATSTASTSTTTGGGTTGDTGDPPSDCPPEPIEPGEHLGLEIEHDGQTRSYDLYVPSAYDGVERLPLVFNFHGLTSDPGQQAFFSQMNEFAEASGAVVVYPAGVMSSWNAGVCCGYAMDNDLDDVGFVRTLADELHETRCVDPDRTYATGMSNGGFLSHRLACEASDVFAAIAPVAGVLGVPPEDCQPNRPVPVMHFHGTLDGLVPYEGNEITGFPSAPETFAGWADRNGCTDAPEITFEQGNVTCETYDDCEEQAEVTLCTAEGDGHCWPGNTVCPFGASTTDIHASEAALEFFEQWSL